MLIAVFGESCTGKSTLAEKLATSLSCDIFTGKDYLRLAKNENIARELFQKKLAASVDGENMIYVIAEREHLALLPEGRFAFWSPQIWTPLRPVLPNGCGEICLLRWRQCWKRSMVASMTNRMRFTSFPAKRMQRICVH